MGDFNLADIDWSLYLGTSVATQKIVDCIPLKKAAKRSKKAPWMSYKAVKLVDKKTSALQ